MNSAQGTAPAPIKNAAMNTAAAPSFETVPKPVGYGLPCANCRTYYAADMKACPICKSAERVSPVIEGLAAAVLSDTVPDDAVIEEERERFLRQFKSQVYAAHTQIDAAASFRCSVDENHQGDFEEASVCRHCYDAAKERTDVLEAALHMDLADATQVIYDAVWADSSDPSKTYQNAAQALLSELRKRAGIATVLGPNSPKPH